MRLEHYTLSFKNDNLISHQNLTFLCHPLLILAPSRHLMLILLANPREAPAYTPVLKNKSPALNGYLQKRLNIVVGNLIKRVSGPGVRNECSWFVVALEHGRAKNKLIFHNIVPVVL